jgi:mono/diheme cytochrome c family protein
VKLLRAFVITVTATAIYAIVSLTAQQPAQGGAYTPEQAEAGRIAYEANCSGCHGPTWTVPATHRP